MGINYTILNTVKSILENYGCHENEIERFLAATRWGFRRRQKEAISIIKKIMMPHGKQELLRHVVELARVEHGIRELEPWVRDHVVHAVLSYLLGIYINEHFMKPSGLGVDPFQWKLAGLFHDVGYPAQVAQDILNPFAGRINRIKRKLYPPAPDVFFAVTPFGIDRLRDGTCSLDHIQGQLNDWQLSIDAHQEYEDMLNHGKIYHGIISSLSLLYVIDLMYQAYNPNREHRDIYEPAGINWNQSYFEKDVVQACSAIFIHNLPDRCLKTVPLDRERAPLAFLLKLSDCLQDWDRPSAKNPRGISNNEFQIEISDGKLVFTVDDNTLRCKINDEIAAAIVTTDIEIH